MEVPSSASCCAGCNQPITERYILKALDKPWHSKCFCCSVCQIQLTKECYTRGGCIYCKSHFSEVGKIKEAAEIKEGFCAACNQPIPPNDLIRRAHGNIYHAKCFACSMCRRKISTGDEFYLKYDKKLVCKADYEALKTQCAGCSKPIPHNHAMRRAQGNVYHLQCFACVMCKRQLCTGDEFYLRQDKKLLCKDDYESAKKSIIAGSGVVLSYGGVVGEEMDDGRQANYEIAKPRGAASVMSNDAAYSIGSTIHEKMDGGRKANYQLAKSQGVPESSDPESSDLVFVQQIANPEFILTGTAS